MRHKMLAAALMALALTAGIAASSFADSPMIFDDQGYHPNMLRPGTAEYDLAVKRQQGSARPVADSQRLNQAMERCSLISPLSQATREKCEIRAHQAAVPYSERFSAHRWARGKVLTTELCS